MNNTLLHIDQLHCGYGSRPVLKGVSLSLQAGETVLLAGPNGCGKSTFLKAIVGMLPLTSGSVTFLGKDVKSLSVEQRVCAGIGYLRQSGNIFPGLTVRENMALSGLLMSRHEQHDSMERMLGLFDFLKPCLERRAGALSGGQRQALAISMILMHPRSLYLLDEPTAGLSPKTAADIVGRIQQFAQASSSQTVLMVEHRLELLKWIDRAVILMQGEIKVETNDTSLLFDPQWLAKHYF